MEFKIRASKKEDLPEMDDAYITIPGSFRLKNGQYEDICPCYHVL